MGQLLNTVFKCLAEFKLVGCSPDFLFLHKIACQPFSSSLEPRKPSWVSNGSVVVLVKLKTEFSHSFLLLVFYREVWGFKTLLNEKNSRWGELLEIKWSQNLHSFYWKSKLNPRALRWRGRDCGLCKTRHAVNTRKHRTLIQWSQNSVFVAAHFRNMK